MKPEPFAHLFALKEVETEVNLIRRSARNVGGQKQLWLCPSCVSSSQPWCVSLVGESVSMLAPA